MDREYHILEGDCAQAAQTFQPYANEAFLVTLGNKGLYKRALKDMEVLSSCTLSAEGEGLLIKLPDADVRLSSANLADSRCSCPSRAVCKHLLMAVLVAAEYAQSAVPASVKQAPEQTAAIPEAFLELKQVDLDALQKKAGKRAFSDAMNLVRTGWGATLIEGEMLEAALTSEPVSVYFPREQSIQRAVCKCGETGICSHKLVAILSYLAKVGALPESVAESCCTPDGRLLSLLESAKGYAAAVLEKGLVCCGETDAEAAVQLSLRLESVGAGNLARLARSFSNDLQNMRAKNASFRPETAFATLSRLYNTAVLVLEHPKDTKLAESLIEGGRSTYDAVPRGSFWGLGAYPWQTRSGFCGITALLYYEEKQQICTCTTSLADYYEKTASLADSFLTQLNTGGYWAQNLSLQSISKSRFTLTNFRINRQNRISSSQRTSCAITGQTCAEQIPMLPEPQPVQESYCYFPRRLPEQVWPVFVSRISDVRFDRTRQTLCFLLRDEAQTYAAELPYAPYHKQLIQRIERMAGWPDGKLAFWMLCRKRAGVLYPLGAVLSQGVWNFYFEDLQDLGGNYGAKPLV